MKKHAFSRLVFGHFLIVCSLPFLSRAQGVDTTVLSVVTPFDSIAITDVKAVGNLETGSVEVTLRIQNAYHNQTLVSFTGGTFGDFGVIDDKGVKYKYSSYDGPAGMQYGEKDKYSKIVDLQFGGSKPMMFTSVQDTLSYGRSEILKFRLAKVDKTVRLLKDLHILSSLTLNSVSAGQKEFYVRNLAIEWVRPPKKVATSRKVL